MLKKNIFTGKKSFSNNTHNNYDNVARNNGYNNQEAQYISILYH